jgi:uncharacterized protein (DUF4415 family)
MNAKQKTSARISSKSNDLPEITDEWLAGADHYIGKKLVRRGRPPLENPRKLLSLRISPQVIEKWNATGSGWQTRMVQVLERAAPKARVAAAQQSRAASRAG